MAITLNGSLQTQLDTEERQPQMSLTSESPDAEIPFAGQLLHPSVTVAEQWPYAVLLSTGEYACVYSRKDDANHTNLYLKTSTLSRTKWNDPVALTSVASGVFAEYASMAQLSNGNLGIAFSERNGGVQKLRYKVVNTSGVEQVALADLNTTGLWYESSVIKLADNTCLLVGARNNGGTWEIVRFTHASGNWGSWSASSVLTFGGATVTGEKRRPYIQEISATGLSCWIMFDRVDLTAGSLKLKNIYYSKNTASPYLSGTVTMTVLTTLTQTFQADEGPSFVKPASYPTANAFVLSYVFRTTSIKLDNASNPQLPGTTDAWFIYYDASRDYIVMVSRNSDLGVYVVRAVDFVTITQYNASTTPNLNRTIGIADKIRSCYYNNGKLLLGYNDSAGAFDIVDIDAVTVTGILAYNTADANVGSGDYRFGATVGPGIPYSCAIEGTKIWWINDWVYSSGSLQGFRQMWSMDIGNPSLIGSIRTVTGTAMRWLVEQNPNVNGIIDNATNPIEQHFAFWDLTNRVVYVAFWFSGAYNPTTQNDYGRILSFSMEEGAPQIGRCDFSLNSSFPKKGASCVMVDSGSIYFGVPANETWVAAEAEGMGYMPLTLAAGVYTGTCTIFSSAPVVRTTLSGIAGLHLRQIQPTGDGRQLMSTWFDGLGIFQGSSATVYDEVSVPGFPITSASNPTPVMMAAYDSGRNRCYLALDGTHTIIEGSIGGIFVFDLDGDIVQPVYRVFTGVNNASPTSTGTEADLVVGDADDQIKIISNGPGNSIAAFWSRQVSGSLTGERDLMFDQEQGAIDLMPYVTGPNRLSQTIERQPNRYDFNVSQGDLFDPTNPSSLYRYVLDFGRKIVLSLGELVAGTPILQTMYTGYVESGKQSYRIETDPVRSVVAYDVTKPAYDYELILSPSYGDGTFPTLPDGDYPTPGICAHMAFNLLQLLQSEILIGSFGADSHGVVMQLVNMSPIDMLTVALNRFRRVPYVRYDGKLVPKEIRTDLAVTDTFVDSKMTISMNPNEGEGESTNRVTVRAISSDSISVTYGAERITQSYGNLTGGVNPRTGVRAPNVDIYIPYSDDYSRVAVNPFPIWKRWTSVVFAKPSFFKPLTGQDVINRPELYNNPLISGISPDDAALFYNQRGARLYLDTSWYNGPADYWEYILEVWAQPIGTMGQQIEASADDLANQRKIRGHIIPKVVDFPSIDSVAQCQFMADWFLLRVQLARRLVMLQQALHCRQEPGDMIYFKHPKSSELLKGLAITINREWEVGSVGTQNILLGVPE